VLADVLEADGPELERTFRSDARLGSVPFVFMTGSLKHARALRGARVLVKPFKMDEVTSILQSCLRKGGPDSEALVSRPSTH
jgi:CheY-like chemotaxis protein